MRAALPGMMYLELLHAAAVTGQLPVLAYDSATKQSKPTGTFEALDPRQRLDLLQYLVDKILPPAAKEITIDVQEAQSVVAERIQNMSTEDLKRLIDAPAKVAADAAIAEAADQ